MRLHHGNVGYQNRTQGYRPRGNIAVRQWRWKSPKTMSRTQRALCAWTNIDGWLGGAALAILVGYWFWLHGWFWP